MLGHDMSPWTSLVPGSEMRRCNRSNCNHSETRQAPIPTTRRIGDVTGKGGEPNVQDALAILRFLVGLSNPIATDVDARRAANITTPGLGDPTVQDARAILRFLVGLSSPVLDTEWA
jgi:hypothetical protein